MLTTDKRSVSKWFRLGVASLLLVGIFIGMNWCFSEMASAIKLVASADKPANFLFLDDKKSAAPAKPPSPALPPVASASSGRMDPFAPLAEDPNATGGTAKAAIAAKDPFNQLQYTGIVNGQRPADVLAMVQINDPVLGATTVIRKMGEVLDMPNGQQAKIMRITPDLVTLNLEGKTRVLPLKPLLEADKASDQPSATNTPPAGTTALGKPVALPKAAIQ